MSVWTKQKLGDLCDLQQGLAINRKSKYLIVDKSNLALLRITDLINNKEEQYIDTDLIPPQFIADENSLIYSRTGQVGLVFKNRKGVVHNNCFKITPRKNLDINYLFYVLKQKKLYDHVVQIASKSAQPDLTHPAFRSVLIDVPTELSAQRSIASVISSYDDLIENNEKRIKILEEMAQRLYTEWFVKFNFPGHEKVKMVDSETEFGLIPEGWEVGKLKDIVESIKKTALPGEHLKNRKYIPIDCIDSKELLLSKFEPFELAQSSLLLFEPGDVLFGAMRPYFHKVAISFIFGITRSTCLVLRPKKFLYFSALTLFLKETINFASSHTQGSTIPYVNWENVLENKKCIIPDDTLLEKFDKHISLIIRHAENLNSQNINLKNIRDLLIPQLVTGKRELKA